MEVIDAHVHLAPDLSAETLLTQMDAAGVGGALITNQSKYGPDNTRQLAAISAHPKRFALIAGVDLGSPDIDYAVATLRSTPGVVGIRVVEIGTASARLWKDGAYAQLFAASAVHQLPLSVYAPARTEEIGMLGSAYPDAQIVLDHLNVAYSTSVRSRLGFPADRSHLDEISSLLPLASLPNISLKLSAIPRISAEVFPFADIWPYTHMVLAAFGADRIMWGSDWMQHFRECTYADNVAFLRNTAELPAAVKETILAATARRVFRWPVEHG
jgi:L-fuconolactonase